ncbi:hypothetical protein AVEN_258647-1 [Araneus ventricosus]|uniref:BTB domain-containing protein n=1 Tax=Araneus ventricosus TaxID=182803 RepID=A0A4Y2JHX0_ARAVE|nr:hypothetical protein AVEN_258647-1 [Araneus ventricosus]
MDRKKKDCAFISRGAKYDLTWIMHITNLYELSSRTWSPRFKTAEKVEWEILLWTGLSSEEDYLFCTLMRMLDGGPSEVHYSVNCRVFIGPERQADIACKRRQPNYKAFRKFSTLQFRLLSVSDVRRSIGAYIDAAPVKLILQIRLQKKSFLSLRAKSLSVSTELMLWSSSVHYRFENQFYQGKEKETAFEEREEPNKDESEYSGDGSLNCICVGLPESGASSWHPVYFKMNRLNRLYRSSWHFLDFNGHIGASSKPQIYESGAQRVMYPIHIMKKEDSRKNMEILSRDGEITIRTESVHSWDLDVHTVNREWSFSFFTRKSEANICCDLKQLFQNGSKGTNLEIRTERKVLKVHKEIIGARSPVFRAMLSNCMIEKLSNVIDIKEIDSATLKNFLIYVYSGTFVNCVEWEDACNLYVTADKYFVHSLLRICSRQLASCISLDNWEQLLVISHLLNDNELQFAVVSFMNLLLENSICSNGCEKQMMP